MRQIEQDARPTEGRVERCPKLVRQRSQKALLDPVGVLCIATAVWFARELPAIRELVRPIYRRMGILPEVAQGLQTVETQNE